MQAEVPAPLTPDPLQRSGLAARFLAVLPFCIAAAVLCLDQVTKAIVDQNVGYQDSLVLVPWLDGWINITNTHNSGAAFGIFPQGNAVFIVIAVVVSVAIVAYSRSLAPDGILVRVSLGLQLGGALGNLVDRLRFGYVIDFIQLGFTRSLHLTTNNIADFSIVGGVCALGWYLLFMRPAEPVASQAPASADDAVEPCPDTRSLPE